MEKLIQVLALQQIVLTRMSRFVKRMKDLKTPSPTPQKAPTPEVTRVGEGLKISYSSKTKNTMKVKIECIKKAVIVAGSLYNDVMDQYDDVFTVYSECEELGKDQTELITVMVDVTTVTSCCPLVPVELRVQKVIQILRILGFEVE